MAKPRDRRLKILAVQAGKARRLRETSVKIADVFLGAWKMKKPLSDAEVERLARQITELRKLGSSLFANDREIFSIGLADRISDNKLPAYERSLHEMSHKAFDLEELIRSVHSRGLITDAQMKVLLEARLPSRK
ncbi:MAG: hypothetical protein JW772_03920 [Candidatus Diapherotrites archaeon]|nr:hypothetical protein [Candidatus Diapherotrites archaeon]